MKRSGEDTDGGGDGTRGGAVDFERLRRRCASLSDRGSGRSVREAAVRVAAEELGVGAAVFDREAGRFRASATTPAFEAVGGPAAVSASDSLVARAVDAGEARTGAVADPPEGGAAACAVPFGGTSAVVAVTDRGGDGEGPFPPDVAAALSVVAGHAGAALSGLEGGVLRRASGVSADAGLREALSRVLPEYAVVYDADGTCLDAVIGLRGTAGPEASEAVGARLHDLLGDRTADRALAAVRAAVDEGVVRTVEGGSEERGERRYEARVAPLTREAYGRDAALLAAYEVTERHERERELRRRNERLVAFADVVSHDLRNPLNTATGFLELAAAESDDSRLDRVADAHDRMETLIDDLLALARNGREVTDPEPVDLRSAAERAWRTVAPDGRLVVADDATVHADPGRLQQAFENAFRNSAEHAGPAPLVRVGTTADGLYVADDGPGVPADERERVFDPGYTDAADGTGLGLAIVDRVADAHGWTVAVAEGRDGGARVEFDGVAMEPDPDPGDD